MGTVVDILAAVLTSGIGVAAFIVFSIRRRVQHANRLTAGRSSGVPASWLWSPRRAALLHRRLRDCCEVAIQVAAVTGAPAVSRLRRFPLRRRRPCAPGPFERLATEVVTQAVDLDARLVVADRRSGNWRRQALAELADEVRRLESSARRMDTLARSWQAQLGGPQPVSPDLGDRLDALESAFAELRIPVPAADHRAAGRRAAAHPAVGNRGEPSSKV